MLYTILPEKTAAAEGAMMGSDHVYEISAVSYCNTTSCLYFYSTEAIHQSKNGSIWYPAHIWK